MQKCNSTNKSKKKTIVVDQSAYGLPLYLACLVEVKSKFNAGLASSGTPLHLQLPVQKIAINAQAWRVEKVSRRLCCTTPTTVKATICTFFVVGL